MFSIIFFAFVAFILVAGFLVVTGRNKSRRSTADNNPSNTTTRESSHRSMSGFNETRSDDIRNRAVPTQMPLNDLNDFNTEEKSGDEDEPFNRPAS